MSRGGEAFNHGFGIFLSSWQAFDEDEEIILSYVIDITAYNTS